MQETLGKNAMLTFEGYKNKGYLVAVWLVSRTDLDTFDGMSKVV